ncbi:metal-dependent hydrolase [Haloferax mediterranei ATCC 33500]|uniref:Metal-dependent hydrolase n=1 Tax=Haloferax mediterranei (strain ATCC 33500 / DSM 1411 / JCM 8866 / NBRC 14739 / NCIMB 2177 / R-4) TaxID=523841 RepID=I3R6H0_HALMT|nr:metal-dependent hydrolase [Haloferax mediterranei]AFK19830.1 putative membrane-bound metal-dependent hydrolase [Haloferax mediterranei ATCC 33500]AHZ23213.1 metal-dependent hydrolase [Haloferax mediterranei ATCC 33500]ELZ99795.1 putative membrane-bound metal-dependent hydrolase [Haloferax mediterranei ATCC 33500]MDX5987421.1 metal-dependent hydrolase [Haloferax mediterranei ATCC 33500]QCQ73924.1 metal-dependent hydrolase [Haloferax mediterranei ATCC 33500]
MPDLLAHALLAYSLATVASWRYEWISRPYVTVAMAGAFIPDMAKAALVIPSARVEQLLGVPFDWFGLHTAGAVLCSVLVGVLLVTESEQLRVFTLLAVGAASHLVADALLLKPTGVSYPLLWPLTRIYPPTPGLYLSTDIEPAIVLGAAALLVSGVTRYRTGRRESSRSIQE